MTAASVFCGSKAAYLLTDAGSFTPDGTLGEIRSKVFSCDRLRIAGAMSGEGCVSFVEDADGLGRYSPVNDVRQLLEQSASQRSFFAKLPEVIRSASGPLTDGYFQFVFACFDQDAGRPQAFVIGSPGHTFTGLPPFTLAPVTECVMPPVDRVLWPAGELTRKEALAVISEQRRTGSKDGAGHVGGFAELTTVDESGLRTEVIHRWPDRIGKKIIPGDGFLARLKARARKENR